MKLGASPSYLSYSYRAARRSSGPLYLLMGLYCLELELRKQPERESASLMDCLRCKKAIDGFGRKLFASLQLCGWELRSVRRVRKVLRLKTERRMFPVTRTMFSHQCAVEQVPRVELNARLGGQYFERSSALRVAQSGS
jgi:hypothetical protein